MAGVTGDLLLRHFGGRFQWGERDCSTAACDAFAELWGIDPLAPHRGRYRTRKEAEALIAEHGGATQLAMSICRLAGLEWRLPSRARAGDLALLTLAGRGVLGIAVGDGRFAAKGQRGMVVTNGADACWGLP